MWAAACSKLCPTSLCVHACVCMRLCACILAKVVSKPNQHIRARKARNHSQTTVVCHFHHLWTSDKLVKSLQFTAPVCKNARPSICISVEHAGSFTSFRPPRRSSANPWDSVHLSTKTFTTMQQGCDCSKCEFPSLTLSYCPTV